MQGTEKKYGEQYTYNEELTFIRSGELKNINNGICMGHIYHTDKVTTQVCGTRKRCTQVSESADVNRVSVR